MIQIRRFLPEDEAEIVRLIGQIMDGEFQEDKAAFPMIDLEALKDSYNRLGEAFFVADDGGKVVGTVGIKREDDRVALLRRIFVAPPYRKRKIGLQLLNRAIAFCEEVGYQELIFKTTSRMANAIELIRKRGFQSRAKVPMGTLELLKYSLSLKNHKKIAPKP